MTVKAPAPRLRRDWWIVLVILVAGLVGASAWLSHVRPQYQASTQVFVSASGAQVSDLSLGVSFTQQIVKSFADLASSDYVVSRALAEVDADRSIARSAHYAVTASAPVDQTTITITATADDPEFAARLADEVSIALKASVPAVMGARESSVTMTLIRLAEVPTRRSGPSPALILGLAAAGSLAAGLIVLALRSRFSRRVLSAEDLRRDPRLSGAAVLELRSALGPEAVGLLDQRVTAVVSDAPGAHVDSFAAALAAFGARAGSDVLVVDLRTDQDGDQGFWSVVRDSGGLADVVREDTEHGFSVLPAGTADVDGFRALRGGALHQLLAQAVERFDQVVLVVGAGPDLAAVAASALREASHVVVVGVLGRSRRTAIAETAEWAEALQGARPDVVLVSGTGARAMRDALLRGRRTAYRVLTVHRVRTDSPA